ncbi:MAG TPA: trypsin-like peptidase domain-containing protein [Candidatus Hydrogenedentes bacterium]|nr:trypsin-like peptidase domain-containing protein [Candidatus Hydrogenedentota bacterium]HQM49505.1 trypsin-like peptidase domain-containing protein [Candidatus Hydrogenedentota bacterium]
MKTAMFVAVLLVSFIGAAHAGEQCESCAADRFPEAAALLASQGYSPQDYQVLLSWRERARHIDAATITGYRVAPLDGAEPFDIYSDETGKLLSDKDLDKAGITPKRWDLPPVEQLPEVSRQVAKSAESRPKPLGPPKGAQAGEWVLLDPVDMGKVLAEDLDSDNGLNKGAKRIGVFQELSRAIDVQGESATQGQWQTMSDGTRIWTIRIYSPEAVAQRVHFARLDLPQGAQIIVYNAGYPEEAYGPYTGPYPGGTDLWASSCFSESVAVECVVPAGVPLARVHITIDKTAHIYVDFAKIQWTKALGDAGSCNLDAACYGDWIQTSWGVGGIGSIGRIGVLWCTGSLIADSVPDTQIPYFLTAEHCIGSSYEANSVEVYWLWQRETCGGALTPVYDVPRTTGGADLMASSAASAGSDFALLRLRKQPPSELTYLGWSTSPQTVGASVACIHHPSGDYKRISFGDLIAGAAYSTVNRVGWNEGTTEQGSSGSPLMLADTHQIIGQLWRGTASCSMPREAGGWDEFGRFDVTYPMVAAWLGPIEPAGPEDIDKNGFVDATDVQLVVNAALGLTVDGNANVDGDPDGLITAVDIQLVINAALESE